MWFEYTSSRSEARNRQRKLTSRKSLWQKPRPRRTYRRWGMVPSFCSWPAVCVFVCVQNKKEAVLVPCVRRIVIHLTCNSVGTERDTSRILFHLFSGLGLYCSVCLHFRSHTTNETFCRLSAVLHQGMVWKTPGCVRFEKESVGTQEPDIQDLMTCEGEKRSLCLWMYTWDMTTGDGLEMFWWRWKKIKFCQRAHQINCGSFRCLHLSLRYSNRQSRWKCTSCVKLRKKHESTGIFPRKRTSCCVQQSLRFYIPPDTSICLQNFMFL